MISVLLASRDGASLSGLSATFEKNEIETTRAETGAGALSMLLPGEFDLLVVDENLEDMTGVALIEKVVSENPMMNCAAVSSLSPEDFHEATEGLGVMMQLPVKPNQENAEKLIEYLETILNLTKVKAA
ncbi:MAG: response regulator [Desulfobacterales bacterium]|nr:response regulator [Desulfobacterales bacterium]